MREAFYEESAISAREKSEAKLYAIFQVTAIVFAVATVFVLGFSLSYIPYLLDATVKDGQVYWASRVFGLVGYFLTVVLLAGAGLFFWLMKNRFNRSYDYTFVEDELRVSRVYNGKKRKFLKTFKVDQMLKIGRCEGESFRRTCAGMQKREIRYLTPNKEPAEGKEFFYIVYSTSIEKAVYVIEVRKQMIEYLVFAAGRSKWDPQ